MVYETELAVLQLLLAERKEKKKRLPGYILIGSGPEALVMLLIAVGNSHEGSTHPSSLRFFELERGL